MRSRSQSSEPTSGRPIALVCISKHARSGLRAAEPDKLTMVGGKWAWCPSGARAGHDWQVVKPGSLNALRVQLVEVSRLVDVALDKSGESTKPRRSTSTKSRAKRR